MRALTARLLSLVLALAVTGEAGHAAPPDGGRRRQPEDTGERGRDEADPGRPAAEPGPEPGGGDTGGAPARGRFARRPIEAGPPGPPAAATEERELHIAPLDPHGCPLSGYSRLAAALLRLENSSQLMSLEVWGDSHEYAPYQRVIYYLRSPRPVYVTLFWLGPGGDIYVPFSNLRIPANRDVSVDPDSIVVPPLGREQWVAVATLEPLPTPCFAPQERVVAMISGLVGIPSAIGRWEVRSRPDRDRGAAPGRP